MLSGAQTASLITQFTSEFIENIFFGSSSDTRMLVDNNNNLIE